MNERSARWNAFDEAMGEASRQVGEGDAAGAFRSLERAHVLGQSRFGPHVRVHVAMLRVAWSRRDGREISGQCLRLALVPLGHLVGRLPLGNTGGANVSAFAPMPIPPDLERLMNDTPDP